MLNCKPKIIAVLVTVVLMVPALAVYAKEEPKEIRFGCALSLSGELEELGNLYKEGYELWKEYVNLQGGIQIGDEKYLVNIIYYDDESNPQKTASLVKKLITKDKVNFLLGPYGSSCTFEAAVVAERYGIPMVQGGGAAERIFTQGFGYTFGLLRPAGDYFKNILKGAASLYPKPNRVAIVSADDIFSLSAAKGAKQYAEHLGFKVAPFITFKREADLSSVLNTLKNDKSNIVLLCAHFEEAISFVRTAKEVGLSPEMLGITTAPSDPAFVEQLERDANYIFGTTQWTSDLPYYGPLFGSSKDYAQLFRERFGKEPDYHSAAATACGAAYQLALEKASSLDWKKVRDTLASLDAATFYGRIKFNEQGMDICNPMMTVQIQKGKRVTVWPKRFATGSLIYPTPSWKERESVLKVAVLHLGPIGDYGWTYEAHLEAQRMAKILPYIELSERENACGPDTPQIMREYAEAGYKVIFCHSWDFGEYVEQIAPDYPDVIFMWGDGAEKKASNTGIYYGRMYEAKFLVGMVAGAMTKTNKIGYAAGVPISDVIRGIDAFARGVASVNSEAKVYVKWVGEWYNPPKEREVTLSLIDNGCDVITNHSDSYAPAVAAEERGIYYISFNSDLRRFAPHVYLTGAVWSWAPIMIDIVKAVREKTWHGYPGQDWWYGLDKEGVKLAPFSDLVPENVKKMVERKKQAIVKGKFEVFPGMSDRELREIYYFESNVVGKLPYSSTEKKPSLAPLLRVLVVHSYHKEWEWDQDIQRGIVEGLNRTGYIEGQDYELKTFYMDTKITYTTPEQTKQRAKAAIDFIEKFNPDIVFVNDDNALRYVAVEYIERYPEKSLPFVFSGVNANPTIYDPIESLDVPGGLITGALERFPYYEAFSLGKRIFPETSKILLLADKSPSSTFVVNAFKERYLDKAGDSPLQVVGPIQVETFKEWKEKVTECQTKADFIGIMTYHQLKDENGKVVLASEVVDWTVHNSKLPEIGFLSFHTEDGFLAAAGISGYKTGIYVGIIGGEVLGGKNPATIPIIDPKAMDITFNLERAKMLGVKIPTTELAEATYVFHSIGIIGQAE